ncbi:MAG: hypothetical protein RR620_11105 [Clostridium sp.]
MDIKSKGKKILKHSGKILNILIVILIPAAMFFIKYDRVYGVISILVLIGILAIKLFVSEMKTFFLIYSLENTITAIDEKKISIVEMKKNFSEMPSFMQVSNKVYESILSITENVREYVQSKSRNEQVVNKLINSVVNKLDKPVENIQNGLKNLRDDDAELDKLQEEANYIKKLIEDLFESSKATSGVLAMRKDQVDINYILKQAIAEFNSNIESSKLKYEVSIVDRKIILNIDPEKIWRVFQILLENTLKHSLEGTRVYVDSKIDNDTYKITIKSISKQGLNISSDDLYKLIESNEDEKCTGLPLETAKSIIVTLGGQFEITIDGDLFKTEIRFKMGEELKNVTSPN